MKTKSLIRFFVKPCHRKSNPTARWLRLEADVCWFLLNVGLYSLSRWWSYRQSLVAGRLDVIMMVSLWNLTGISVALLPMCLSNFRTTGKVKTRISRLWNFTRSCGKTSVCSVDKGPESDISMHGQWTVAKYLFAVGSKWYFFYCF